MSEELVDIVAPEREGVLTNREILLGRQIPAEKQVLTYSPEEWEAFIREWAVGLEEKYAAVKRVSGPGDKGRDVIGFYGEPGTACEWDNYQCKHYKSSLKPTEAYVEIGKICFYTFQKEYTVPRRSYFVAPHGLGRSLTDLLLNPQKLKDEFIANWDKHCAGKITKTQRVPLEGAFEEWVEAFDFSIFKDLPLADVIEQHSHTRYHAARFGNGLTKPRPRPTKPPEQIASAEVRYVEQLLGVYSERLNQNIDSPHALEAHADVTRHFRRQRVSFYSAESLRVFSRETMPDEQVFGDLQEEIFSAVVDVCECTYKSGFERLVKTLETAQALPLDSHALASYVSSTDKRGVCHQLANEDRLTWLKNKI